MADPLSISAAVVTLVPAFYACSVQLVKVIRGIRDCPDELIALLNETNALLSVFIKLQDICSSVERSGEPNEDMLVSIEKNLKLADKNISDLESFLKPSGDKGLTHRWKWIRKKEPAQRLFLKLRQMREEIDRSLTLFLAASSRCEINEGFNSYGSLTLIRDHLIKIETRIECLKSENEQTRVMVNGLSGMIATTVRSFQVLHEEDSGDIEQGTDWLPTMCSSFNTENSEYRSSDATQMSEGELSRLF
jgi:hypothetical protein